MISVRYNEVRGKFMPIFKITGQLYHRVGSFLPILADSPKFCRYTLLIISEEAARIRHCYYSILKYEHFIRSTNYVAHAQ